MGASLVPLAARVLVSVFLCFFTAIASSAFVSEASLRHFLLTLKGEGLSTWVTSNATSPCNWQGVKCASGSFDVISLNLSGLHLTGTISSEISILQSLTLMDLFNNSLTGSIPPEISNCSSLSTLSLSLNKLSGTIPQNWKKLKMLQVLDLSQNQLMGPIPSEFSDLSAITSLSLSRNRLNDSIPDGIGELANLQIFSAYENNLTGQIPSMKMSNLMSVNLASNFLTGPIPANMCASGKLQVLVLTNNSLNGNIPEDLGSCQSLMALRLGNNNLTGTIPEKFGQLQNLVYFISDHNFLSGELPTDMSGWKNLSLLNLASNYLAGSIPVQLSNASVLQELVLSDNNISGEIPPELAQCKNLSVLQLDMNHLTGSIPDNIFSLVHLQYLQLDGNSLTGEIPPSIGNCTGLLELQLGGNKLNGSIPPQIGDLWNLQVSLNLSRNELIGSIPTSLGKLGRLVSLDLSHNHLSGPIPDLRDMVSLLDWNFSNNLLTGPVPVSGPLANSSSSSFANNPGLCGGPLPPCVDATSSLKVKDSSRAFWKAAGISIACALVLLLIASGIVIHLMHKHYITAAVDPTPPVAISRLFPGDFEGPIDFDSIKEVTGSNANVISTNHFSTIYKTVMPSGLVLAVKKLNSAEKGLVVHQRKVIFELDKMWKYSHENIMQPMGYYLESDLAIIIYDFVPLCSLSQKLHRNFESLLPWSSRYKIAMGAAQGLNFLHHGCNPPMMHMDVSSNNIFLGPNLVVKVGDVEVAKLLDPSKHTGSISTVAGSFGYIAPEYAFTMRVTLASNVYSFGVVLLELLTGRRPVDESFGDGLDLVRWVHGASSRGEMPEQILDARISTQSFASRQEMLNILKLALMCTNAVPLKRPRMKKVLEALQEAKSPVEVLSPVSSF